MNLGKLFYSLINLIVGLFFVLLGLIGLLALWLENVREILIRLIQENAIFVTIFSLGLFLIGIAIVVQVILSTRHQHYKIVGGRHLASVDEHVLQGYLDVYWKQLFPKKGVPNQAQWKNNRIFISAELPYFPSEEQKSLLTKIDTDIGRMLENAFGYKKEFSLQISFNEAQ